MHNMVLILSVRFELLKLSLREVTNFVKDETMKISYFPSILQLTSMSLRIPATPFLIFYIIIPQLSISYFLYHNISTIYLSSYTCMSQPPRGHQKDTREPSVGDSLFFILLVFYCTISVVLVVSMRRASACLIILSARQGSHWYHF